MCSSVQPVNGATNSCLDESSSEYDGGCEFSETSIEGDESAVGEEGYGTGGEEEDEARGGEGVTGASDSEGGDGAIAEGAG